MADTATCRSTADLRNQSRWHGFGLIYRCPHKPLRSLSTPHIFQGVTHDSNQITPWRHKKLCDFEDQLKTMWNGLMDCRLLSSQGALYSGDGGTANNRSCFSELLIPMCSFNSEMGTQRMCTESKASAFAHRLCTTGVTLQCNAMFCVIASYYFFFFQSHWFICRV